MHYLANHEYITVIYKLMTAVLLRNGHNETERIHNPNVGGELFWNIRKEVGAFEHLPKQWLAIGRGLSQLFPIKTQPASGIHEVWKDSLQRHKPPSNWSVFPGISGAHSCWMNWNGHWITCYSILPIRPFVTWSCVLDWWNERELKLQIIILL